MLWGAGMNKREWEKSKEAKWFEIYLYRLCENLKIIE